MYKVGAYLKGNWDMRSDKSYKDPLEFADEYDDDDASSDVSNEEDPSEFVEAIPIDDDFSESSYRSFSIKSHFSSLVFLENLDCSPHEP